VDAQLLLLLLLNEINLADLIMSIEELPLETTN
jgi:hypothetical protein